MSRSRTISVSEDLCCPSVLHAALSDEDAIEVAALFAALGDPVRAKLVSLLAAADNGEVCVCDLVDPLGKAQPTVSHQCKVLVEAGLIVGEKRGRWVWYRIVPERLEAVRNSLR